MLGTGVNPSLLYTNNNTNDINTNTIISIMSFYARYCTLLWYHVVLCACRVCCLLWQCWDRLLLARVWLCEDL